MLQLHVRNIYTGQLAYVASQGRHRVTVWLADGSYEEWLTDETDFDVSRGEGGEASSPRGPRLSSACGCHVPVGGGRVPKRAVGVRGPRFRLAPAALRRCAPSSIHERVNSAGD
jgi:hypothetical protein